MLPEHRKNELRKELQLIEQQKQALIVDELGKPDLTYPRRLQIRAELTDLHDRGEKVRRQLDPVGRLDRELDGNGKLKQLRFAYRDESGRDRKVYVSKSLEAKIRQSLESGESLEQILSLIESRRKSSCSATP